MKVRNCAYFSLLADWSSDEAYRTKLFAILILCLVNQSVDDHVLGLIHVARTEAVTLMGGIKIFLIAKGIDISKAMFVGFDGCNTMSEEKRVLVFFFFFKK